MDDCQRCVTPENEPTMKFEERARRRGIEVRLLGGRLAILCVACRNEWTDFVREVTGEPSDMEEAHTAFEEATNDLEIVKINATAGEAVDPDYYRLTIDELKSAERKIYALSVEWLKTKRKEA